MYTPMLDWYRGECMVSIVSINNGMQELICGCQNCNTTNQISILDRYVKVRESLYIRVILYIYIFSYAFFILSTI
jgi:hypothetical protein